MLINIYWEYIVDFVMSSHAFEVCKKNDNNNNAIRQRKRKSKRKLLPGGRNGEVMIHSKDGVHSIKQNHAPEYLQNFVIGKAFDEMIKLDWHDDNCLTSILSLIWIPLLDSYGKEMVCHVDFDVLDESSKVQDHNLPTSFSPEVPFHQNNIQELSNLSTMAFDMITKETQNLPGNLGTHHCTDDLQTENMERVGRARGTVLVAIDGDSTVPFLTKPCDSGLFKSVLDDALRVLHGVNHLGPATLQKSSALGSNLSAGGDHHDGHCGLVLGNHASSEARLGEDDDHLSTSFDSGGGCGGGH